MIVEMGKEYRTSGGNKVRIYATDGNEHYPVHGAILVDGEWLAREWTRSGKRCFGFASGADLIEVKPRIKGEVWVNVYVERGDITIGNAYISQEEARFFADVEAKACVKVAIDCEEGEGME